MTGFGKYFVTGWSARFGHWITEHYECATMEAASHLPSTLPRRGLLARARLGRIGSD